MATNVFIIINMCLCVCVCMCMCVCVCVCTLNQPTKKSVKIQYVLNESIYFDSF